MELFECHKFLLEVLWVELIIRVKSENTVVFELPLKEFSDLRCCQLPGSESFGRLLGCSIELVLLVLNHLYSCLEEPILLGSSHNLLFELRLWLDDLKVWIDIDIERLRHEADLLLFDWRTFASGLAVCLNIHRGLLLRNCWDLRDLFLALGLRFQRSLQYGLLTLLHQGWLLLLLQGSVHISQIVLVVSSWWNYRPVLIDLFAHHGLFGG